VRAFAQQAHSSLDLGRSRLRNANLLDPGDKERIPGKELDHTEPAYAAEDGVVRSISGVHISQELDRRTDPVKVFRAGLLDFGVSLQENADGSLLAHGLLNGGDRSLAADGKRHHQPRKENGLSNGDDDESILREGLLAGGVRSRLGFSCVRWI
jgi:hypothetical protein